MVFIFVKGLRHSLTAALTTIGIFGGGTLLPACTFSLACQFFGGESPISQIRKLDERSSASMLHHSLVPRFDLDASGTIESPVEMPSYARTLIPLQRSTNGSQAHVSAGV